MAVPAKRTQIETKYARSKRRRQKLAAQRKEIQERRRAKRFLESLTRENANADLPEEVKETAARLYGQGFQRRQIARALVGPLTINSAARTDEQRLTTARRRLRSWETQKSFRDMVWKHAVVELDMSTPDILAGISRSAKRGRVDAARLALEVTGRHTKDEAAPTNVTIQIANIPRPS